MSYTVVTSDIKTLDIETGRDVLDDIDATIEPTTARTPAEVIDAIEGADALIVDAGTPVTAEVLAAADSLRVVGRAGIGVDNVDVAAAANEGVTVVNVPAYCVEEVSTHALALLLACVRKVPLYDDRVKGGTWDWEVGRPMDRLRGKTVGLLAFGKIARRFAEKVRGFDVEVLAYDPYVPAAEMEPYGVRKASFEELLVASELLSVHAPLTDETRGMLDAAAFDTMGEGAVLVNTARGPIVDTDALSAALAEGTIAVAGLDVMPEEPPDDSPLLDREDVIVTPHTAWYSEDSRRELSRSVAADVARVLRGEAPEAAVDPDSGWF